MLVCLSMINGQAIECNSLPGNTACGPSFEGYRIATSVERFVDGINSISDLRTIADSFIYRNCTNVANRDVEKLRYQKTIQCAMVVQYANGCGLSEPEISNLKLPKVCKSACKLALSTYSSIAENSYFCPKTDDITGERFINTCSNASDDSDCYIADFDKSFCGFIDGKTASAMCTTPELADDECCINYLNSKKTLVIIMSVGAIIGFVFIASIAHYLFKRSSNSITRKSTSKRDLEIAKFIKDYKEVSGNIGNLFTGSRRSNTFSESVYQSLSFPIRKTMSKQLALNSNTSKLQTNTIEKLHPLMDVNSLEKVKVFYDFETKIHDELNLRKDEILYVLKRFDDGWCLGLDPATSDIGVFPDICVKEMEESTENTFKELQRNSNCVNQSIYSNIATGDISVRSVDETFESKTDTTLWRQSMTRNSMNREDYHPRASSTIASKILKGKRPKLPFSLYLSQLDGK
jgi:hypothetical protein